MKYLISTLVLLAMIAGVFIGYKIHPEPGWDIMEDPRGCIIEWDDGTYSYKSRTIYLGSLAPGESKTFRISD